MSVILAVVFIIAVFLFILIVRTLNFKSKQVRVESTTDIDLKEDKAAEHLAQAIRFKTISHQGGEKSKAEEILKLHNYLIKIFPKVHANLKREVIENYSLLYTWEGEDSNLKPILLMSHMDVVPIEPGTEDRWNHPPFDGKIGDGYIWGRGSLDDKCGVIGILEAVEFLLGTGFRPKRTIYLSFGYDEEIGGLKGTAKVVELLDKRGVEFEYVLDEGAPIAQGMIPGINSPVALVGIAEKGYLSLEIIAESKGGHSSKPPAHTTVGRVSTAIHRLERNQLSWRMIGPIRQMFRYLGPEMSFFRKMLFANFWIFGTGILKKYAADPSTNALIRTTTAATMFEGSIKENILPSKARAVVNFRILPGDSVGAVTEHVRSVVNDPQITVKPYKKSWNPSKVADVESPNFDILQRSIREVFDEAIVAPYLVIGATDSRYYAGLADNIYHFLPITMTPDDLGRMHGTNERIAVEGFKDFIKFYIQLIKNSNQ